MFSSLLQFTEVSYLNCINKLIILSLQLCYKISQDTFRFLHYSDSEKASRAIGNGKLGRLKV